MEINSKQWQIMQSKGYEAHSKKPGLYVRKDGAETYYIDNRRGYWQSYKVDASGTIQNCAEPLLTQIKALEDGKQAQLF